MPAASSPPQFDLFEAQPETSRQRVGRKPHVPSLDQMLLAKELKAAGATWPEIGRALGVSRCTLARHYFPSAVTNPPKGRRRHAPTPATRKIVQRAILGGMPVARVAKLIGVSVPTLRLHYGDELQP
jgi:DNA invertase Pin-like site-specific DNA recombinase